MAQPCGKKTHCPDDAGLHIALQVSNCKQRCLQAALFIKGNAISSQGGTFDLIFTQLIFIPHLCLVTQMCY